MRLILKNLPAFILLLITIAAAIVAFYATIKDNQQKDNIEDLSKQTNRLSELNKSIGENVEKITTENNKLSKENIELSTQAKDLITEVQHLSEKSKVLIDKIEKTTTNTSEENLLSGGITLKLKFIPPKQNVTALEIKYGGNTFGLNLSELNAPADYVSNRFPYLKATLDDKKNILFTTMVYDIDGNVVAEIENNYWRPNKNFISKYNYDENGFEVIDNKGHIVLSIDIKDGNKIRLQGIFIDKESTQYILAGISEHVVFDKNTKQGIAPLRVKKSNISTPEALDEEIKKVKFQRLFKYNGEHWLHKRVTQ